MSNRYGLEIRAASAADASGLGALLAASGADLLEGPDAAHETARRLDGLLRAEGVALVAVEWGPPSGFVALQPVHALDAASPFGLITTLLVEPSARRRGLGRLLVKAAGRAARLAGCDRLALAATPRADLAAFAEATGFAAQGAYRVRPLLRRGARDA